MTAQPATPTFTTVTETATGRGGVTTHVTVVLMDGKPAFSFTTTGRVGTTVERYEHVVSGVQVYEPGEFGINDDVRHHSIAATGSRGFAHEPTTQEVMGAGLDTLAYDRGATFITYGDKGAPVPEGERPAFYDAVKSVGARIGRRTRSGVLTGNPRSW